MTVLVGPIAPCCEECPFNGSGTCQLTCNYNYRPSIGK